MKVSITLALLVLMVSFLAVAAGYGQALAEESYEKGLEYGTQGKFKEAKEQFEKALKVDPFHPGAEYTLRVIGDVIEEKLRREEAILYFKGVVYARKSQWDQAISDFNKALEINPGFAEAYISRGFAYRGKGQYDQAISDYNKALEINPRHAWVYYNRGLAYAYKGQDDQAISDYNKALEISPRLAVAYNNRAVAYYYKREYDRAWDDVYKAQALGFQVPPAFLDALRKASGRKK